MVSLIFIALLAGVIGAGVLTSARPSNIRVLLAAMLFFEAFATALVARFGTRIA